MSGLTPLLAAGGRGASAVAHTFLGAAPRWYKLVLAGCLVANPLLLALAGPAATAWAILAEFVFTLAMSLSCHPLPPAGLLAVEAVALGLMSPQGVYDEVRTNLSTLLLLVFMVAGVYFLRDALLVGFTRLFVAVRAKLALPLAFVATAALLSAFLDALTVVAVIIAVATGLYAVYHRVASRRAPGESHDHTDDALVHAAARQDLLQFRAFLRGLLMHAAAGTALGGLTTLVGEPQNLLIGDVAGWDFGQFLVRVAPVSVPVLAVGFLTTVLLETTGWFGYGARLPASVRDVLEDWVRARTRQRDTAVRVRLAAQWLIGVFLVVALALHLAPAGLIGLAVIVLATAFTGVVEEHAIGRAFQDALPFAGLLVVFFAIVAMIDRQGLFAPVIAAVLARTGTAQALTLFGAAGILSMVSDNVFVASTYINQVAAAFHAGAISREQFDVLAVVVNAGTNIPSIATPNGQAAFLFLLTSPLAALIRLDYLAMLRLALPYACTMTAAGLAAVAFLL